MKLLFDFLPIILFFGTFKFAEGRKEAAAEFASDHLGFFVSGANMATNARLSWRLTMPRSSPRNLAKLRSAEH